MHLGNFPEFPGDMHMSYIGTYLDQLILKKSIKSDSSLADYLQISRQHLSRIRIEGNLSEEKCLLIARELDIDPLELFSYMRARKAVNPEVKKVWMDLHRNIKRVKASILLNSNS